MTNAHTHRYQTIQSSAQRPCSSRNSQAYCSHRTRSWFGSKPRVCRFSGFGPWSLHLPSLFPPVKHQLANQLLLDFGPRAERGLAEGEGIAACLQLTLPRAPEIRPDDVQLGGWSRALGLGLGLTRFWLVQRGSRPVVKVRVGVGIGVQPGVIEAFFCCGPLPVHTNTITLCMSGNSRRVYITDGLLGSSHSLNPFS